MMLPWPRIVASSLLCLPLVAHAAGTTDEAVVAMRIEVERLAGELAQVRAEQTEQLAALRAERVELARALRAARSRNAQLRELQAQDAARDEAELTAAARGRAPAMAAIAAVRGHVRASLPFARADREAELDRIEASLQVSEPDLGRAMQRLWRFVEQDLALAGEIELTQQVVATDGAEQLAEVLRIGMAVMYVRAPDGTVAWTRRDGDGWRIDPIEDPASIADVRALFDAYHDNRGFGPAMLPLPSEALRTEATP